MTGDREGHRLRVGLLVVALMLALGACGNDGAEEAPRLSTVPNAESTTSVPPTTAPSSAPTTVAPRSGGAASCASLAARAVDLLERWRNDMRGVAGPQREAEHRAEARALAAEARRLGCPVPAGAEQIIEG